MAMGGLEQWVTVGLHGDDVVFEETIEPPRDDGSELMGANARSQSRAVQVAALHLRRN